MKELQQALSEIHTHPQSGGAWFGISRLRSRIDRSERDPRISGRGIAVAVDGREA